MKLKSYFRGIGAGMIIAALIMGLSVPKTAASETPPEKQTLIESVTSVSVSGETSVSKTDESDKTQLSVSTSTSQDIEISAEPEPEPVTEDKKTEQDTESQTGIETQTGSEVQTELVDNNDTSASIEDGEVSEAEEPDEGDSEENTDTDVITLKIEKGDSSVKVARKAYEAGLVESAPKFNDYLCNNGYAKSIKVGTFKIPAGSTYNEIAKIISRKK